MKREGGEERAAAHPVQPSAGSLRINRSGVTARAVPAVEEQLDVTDPGAGGIRWDIDGSRPGSNGMSQHEPARHDLKRSCSGSVDSPPLSLARRIYGAGN
jgi:hypothetical protein